MSARGSILIMLLATILAWVSWLLVLLNINPFEASWWGFTLFYGTFFLSVFGLFTVLGFMARTLRRAKRTTMRYTLITSVRQSFLWALALIAALALQAQRLLTWWIFALVVIVFVLIEYTSATVYKHSSDE